MNSLIKLTLATALAAGTSLRRSRTGVHKSHRQEGRCQGEKSAADSEECEESPEIPHDDGVPRPG